MELGRLVEDLRRGKFKKLTPQKKRKITMKKIIKTDNVLNIKRK